MIGVLVGSLASAYTLVAARRQPWLAKSTPKSSFIPVNIGDLQLQLPKQIANSNRVVSSNELFDLSVLLTDSIAKNRQLLVAVIREFRPRSPLVVLNQMLNQLIPQKSRSTSRPWQPATNFRSESLIGASYGGISQSVAGYRLNLIAVLTEDGRRYWTIHINHLIEKPSLVTKAIVINRQLMANIINGAVGQNLRDATAKDFFTAGLGDSDSLNQSEMPNWVPVGLRPRIGINSCGQDPILLIPNNYLARVAVLRIRGVIDTGRQQPHDPLSPVSLLTDRFTEAHGKQPVGQELWTGRVADMPVWRIALTATNQSLVRYLWYAQIGPSKGTLVELLCEPEALASTIKWIAPLLEAIKTKLKTDASPKFTLTSAIDRGRKIAHGQMDSVASRGQSPRACVLIEENQRLIGAQLEMTTITAERDQPFQGYVNSLRMLNSPKMVQIQQWWQVPADGSQFLLISRFSSHQPNQTDRLLYITRMQLSENQITFKRTTTNGPEELWSHRVPEGFVLPMAEETWPKGIDLGNNEAQALVWMTRSRHRPKPFWIRLSSVARDSSGTSPDSQAAYEMWIRPLMSLDSDHLTYDDQGNLLSYNSSRINRWTNGAIVRATRVDEQLATEAFPMLIFQANPLQE